MVGTGLRYLRGFVLLERDPVSAINALRLVIFISSSILAYILVHPKYLIYLLNPTYEWFFEAIRVIALASLLIIVNGGVGEIVASLISERGVRTSKKILRIRLISLAISITYLTITTTGLFVASTKECKILYWSIAILLDSLITSLVFLILPSRSIKFGILMKALMIPLVMYFAVGLIYAYIFPPQEVPSEIFWKELWILFKSSFLALIFYTLTAVIADSFICAEIIRDIMRFKEYREKLHRIQKGKHVEVLNSNLAKRIISVSFLGRNIKTSIRA